MANKSKEKTEHQKINVYVRLRPLNENEKAAKAHSVFEVLSGCEIAVKQHNGRKFRFNQVFGTNCPQLDIYLDVVSPMVRNVLDGYNCSLFAYGPSNSGKTYTMMGNNSDYNLSWKREHSAGFIPRACLNILSELEHLTEHEYTVRVSYIEIHNEEIIDLLSDTKTNSNLRVYGDSRQKGQVHISNLIEMTICSRKDIFGIFDKSIENKETAHVNAHRIFTIIIHIKEVTVGGNDLIKTARFNLVDLASSENTSSSVNKNAHIREPSALNSSLNNLMKVIQALNEGHQYVPYRESKLTRILQDSFGGCTRTSFVVTISPSNTTLEESINALDFANQIKNIVNTPSQNVETCYQDLIKSMKDEVDMLKKDLWAMRTGRGMNIDDENYKKLISESEEYKKLVLEKTIEMQNLQERVSQLETDIILKEKQLKSLAESFAITKNKLAEKEIEAKLKEEEVKKEKFVAEYFKKTNKEVFNKTNELAKITDNLTQKNNLLHKKVETLYDKLGKNTSISETVFLFLQNNISNFKSALKTYQKEQNKTNRAIDDTVFSLESITKDLLDTVTSIKSLIEDFSKIILPEFENNELHVNNQLKLHSQMLTKTDQLTCIYNKFSDATGQFFAFRRTLLDESMKLFNQNNTGMSEMITASSDILKTLEDINMTTFESVREVNSFKTFMVDETATVENNLRIEQSKLFLQVDYWKDIKKNVTNSCGELQETKLNLWRHIKLINNIRRSVEEKFNPIISNLSNIKTNEFDIKCFQTNFEKTQQKVMEIMEESKKHISDAKAEVKEHLDEAENIIKDLEQDSVNNKNMTIHFKEVIQNNELLKVSELRPIQDKISSHQDLLMKNVDSLCENHIATSALDNMHLNLGETIVNQMQPVEHEGDTPKRETYKYPNMLERQLHRNILLEKYNQIREVNEESDP